MQFEGALIKEQGVQFAIVLVKSYVLNSPSQREDARTGFAKFFPFGIPIILASQDSRGIPTYHGRKDIVNFLANIHISQIPWKRYTV